MALTGFDLTAYLSWICYFSYYIRVKIYSYLSLLIFNNLIWHYYHPINSNLVCSVGRLFLINRRGSIINYSYNHYWTTRLCFYLFQKDQIKIITFSLLAVKEKFSNSFIMNETYGKRVYYYKRFDRNTYHYYSYFYQDIKSIWNLNTLMFEKTFLKFYCCI